MRFQERFLEGEYSILYFMGRFPQRISALYLFVEICVLFDFIPRMSCSLLKRKIMDVDETISTNLTLRESMLEYISLSSEAHFKSQQLNEPDLTFAEKRQIAESILDNNPGCFLSRFGPFLLESHLNYFADLASGDYEVNYYVTDLRKKFQKTFSKSVVRNRRLEAIRRLSLDSEYFTDEEMRKRNPLMYEHMVGQYLTEDEKMSLHAERIGGKSFSGIILSAIDENEVQDRLKQENFKEESPRESDSDCISEPEYQQTAGTWGEFTPKNADKPAVKEKKKRKKKNKKIIESLSEEEKTLKMNEFRSHMYSEFLGGKDSDFDYSKVDTNNDYDDLEMLESDQQDQYFDSELPELILKSDESSDSSLAANLPPPRSLVQKMADLET